MDWRDPSPFKYSDIEVRRSVDAGRTWGPLMNVTSSPTTLESPPALASTETSAVVGYSTSTVNSTGDHDYGVRLTRIAGDQVQHTSFDSPVWFNTFGWPSLTANENTYVAALPRGHGAIQLSTSTDDGRTFSEPAPTAVTENECWNNCIPAVALSGSHLTIAYLSRWREATKTDVAFIVSDDMGATWRDVALPITPGRELPVGLAYSGSTLYAGWIVQGDTSTAWVTTSSDHGTTWDPPTMVGTLGSTFGNIDLIAPTFTTDAVGTVTMLLGGSTSAFSTSDQGDTWADFADLPDQSSRGYDPIVDLDWINGRYVATSWTSSVFQGVVVNKPAAPTVVTAASRTPGQVDLTWSHDGGRVDEFVITSLLDGKQVRVEGTARTRTLTGLAAGAAHKFTVVARNRAGDSLSTESNGVNVEGPPAAPTAVAPTVRGLGVVSVAWQAPGNSTIDSFRLSTVPGSRTVTVDATQRSASLSGLSPRTRYTFQVTAVNAAGPSTVASSPSVMLPDRPAAPARPRVTVLRRSATAAWTKPADNGSPMTGFTVDISSGTDRKVTGTTLRAAYRSLRPGTYWLRVYSHNAMGRSAPSPKASFRVR